MPIRHDRVDGRPNDPTHPELLGGEDWDAEHVVHQLTIDSEFEATEDVTGPPALLVTNSTGDTEYLSVGANGSSVVIRPDDGDHGGGDALVVYGPSGQRVLATSQGNGDATYSDRIVIAPQGGTSDVLSSGAPLYGPFRVMFGGAVVIGQTAEPADADLTHLLGGQMAIWFDATNGAAKLMVKAKTVDGTVVRGELPLT